MESTEAGRVNRTRRDIKNALLELLKKKSLDLISMSEIARGAHVSRSTLYQHYGNARDIYDDIVEDFKAEVSPIMTNAACFEGEAEPGSTPFCELIRTSDTFRSIIDSPCFLDAYVATIEGNAQFLEVLTSAGYTPEMAHSLAVFQVNGCFKAAKTFGHDEAKWREVRSAIDTFVCGGLAECSLRNRVQGHGGR